MLCVICGKEFKPKCVRQKTCGLECGEVLRQKSNSEYRQRVRNMPKTIKREIPKKKKIITLNQIARMACEENMSYGQWVLKHEYADKVICNH